jgi:hypothetical protein
MFTHKENHDMIDVIHKKYNALGTTTFGKMRLMKIGSGVDCVDCDNMNALMHMKVLTDSLRCLKLTK